jgi:DNA mismatch endonuclease (patch repair protein)
MSDVFSKEKRSEIMSLIKSKDTAPERLVFKELRKRGIYFQKHYKRISGSPDVALPSKRLAVFIDGDFWHGYRFSRFEDRLPKIYWLGKIEANIRRDKRDKARLRRAGWKVLRIWEHEIKKDLNKTMDKIEIFLKSETV